MAEEQKTAEVLRRELKMGGLITLATAPGLLVLGAILSLLTDGAVFAIMFGVSTLVGFIGAALFAGAWFYPDEETAPKTEV